MRTGVAVLLVGVVAVAACGGGGDATPAENGCDALDVGLLDGRFGLSVESTSSEGLDSGECAVELMDGSSLLISVHDSMPRAGLEWDDAERRLDNLERSEHGSIFIPPDPGADGEYVSASIARVGDRFVRIDRRWEDPEFAPVPDTLEPVADFLLSTDGLVSVAERIEQLSRLPTEFTWECRAFLTTATGAAQLTLVLDEMSEIGPDGSSSGTALIGIDATGWVGFGARDLDPAAACDDIAVEQSPSPVIEQSPSEAPERWSVSDGRIDYSTTGEGARGGCVVMTAVVSDIVVAVPDGTEVPVGDLVLTNTGFGSFFPDGCRYPDFTTG